MIAPARCLLACCALSATLGVPALADEISDTCVTATGPTTLTDYTTFATQAFFASEWATDGETITSTTPGTLVLPAQAANNPDEVVHAGTMVETSARTLHITTPGDLQGGGLIPAYRPMVLRSHDVQAFLTITTCGALYFNTWTQPTALDHFVWPDAR